MGSQVAVFCSPGGYVDTHASQFGQCGESVIDRFCAAITALMKFLGYEKIGSGSFTANTGESVSYLLGQFIIQAHSTGER